MSGVRFLSRAEREALRKELEDREKLEQDLAIKAARDSRAQFVRRKEEAAAKERKKQQEEAETDRRRKDERRRREDAERRKAESSKDESVKKKAKVAIDDEEIDMALPEEQRRQIEEVKEREQIRDHYLGLRRDRKKVQKPSEKFRNIFQFDWDNTDDTTRGDYNPLYHSKHEPQLLFGRGFRAGVDVREQRRKNMFYDALAQTRKRKLAELEAKGLTGDALSEAVLEELAVTSLSIEEFKKKKNSPSDRDMDDDGAMHWSKKSREEMTSRDWRIFREDFSIYIKGGRVPNPVRNWNETELPKEILVAVESVGYEKPTPIQMQAIPIALEMRDMIGLAETGSGKTAAFMLPMLSYVKRLPRLTDETAQSGPYGLVLAPSRELALQIRDEAEKFTGLLQIRNVAIVGGRNTETQGFQLRRGAEIVIGTPGRVKDCLEKAYTVLMQCNYVVLDEADRMIDLGFEEIVNWILDQIPSTNMKSSDLDQAQKDELAAKAGYRQYRVTQMFSATMPSSVERLAKRYLRQPAIISVGNPGEGKKAIEQVVEFVAEPRKKTRLAELLERSEPPVMVFVNQKKNADMLVKHLTKLGFRAVALHGGKAQDLREESLELFKQGDADILVATDVAGRGIDVEGVQLVVNYDMPNNIEAYTHRIGRTGRAGKEGKAFSFLTEEDSLLFFDLKNLLVATGNAVPSELANHSASKTKPTPITNANTTTNTSVPQMKRW